MLYRVIKAAKKSYLTIWDEQRKCESHMEAHWNTKSPIVNRLFCKFYANKASICEQLNSYYKLADKLPHYKLHKLCKTVISK